MKKKKQKRFTIIIKKNCFLENSDLKLLFEVI